MTTTSDFFIYWDSRSEGYLECFEDQKKTTPMNLHDVDLLLIGKKRISDTDEDAIFSLTLGDGLTLREDVEDENIVDFVIPPVGTTPLPRTKTTTIWLELIAKPTDVEFRQTLDQFDLPVKPSIKDLTEAP